ncbi:MAG: MinD/ParA family protein [Myxococcales bacterium]|nr:MinD/ParA family protein [Myxococcales bacterium]
MDQAELLRKKAQEHREKAVDERVPAVEGRPVRVISITSGKGGVGKTNVAANLGIALSRLQRKVLIFDTDLGLANIDVVLGLKPQYTIQHVLTGEKRIQDVIVEGPGGLLILPASSGVDEVPELTESERLDLVAQFENWEIDLDVMILDTGAGIGPNVMYFNVVAQQIVVVVTPEPTSMTDAYALMKVLSTRYQEKRFHLLVNMVRDEKQGLDVYRHLAKVANRFLDISIDFLGWVPHDPNLTKAVQKQTPILDAFPNSPAAKTFAKLAQNMLEMEIPKSPKGNIQFLWRHVLRAG